MSDVAPQSMTAQQLADFLSKAGASPVTDDEIEADLAAGAPKNSDGTLNLLHYTAWLATSKR
jgi:hypothetical protein